MADLDLARALVAHPRWQWREGMLARWERPSALLAAGWAVVLDGRMRHARVA